MNNQDIRHEIMECNVKHWQVADKLNISEGKFCRMLRKELPNEEKEKIRQAIKELQEALFI